MPGFFDIFFRPEPEPEPSKPKPKKVKKAKKVEKRGKEEKAKPFVHPLKEKVASLEAELERYRTARVEEKEVADDGENGTEN